MAGPNPTITISGVDSRNLPVSTSASSNFPIHHIPIPTSRHQVQYQAQAQGKTTTATIPIQNIPTSRHQVRHQTQAGPETQTQRLEQYQTQMPTQEPAQIWTQSYQAQARCQAQHQALVQAEQQKQTQKHTQTTTAFIFHISTLIYSSKTSTTPSSIRTTGTNSDATWSPISVSDSDSITGYTSSASDSSSTTNDNPIRNRIHPNPLRQHQIVNYLLPRPSAGETIAKLQAVGVLFVVIWEPSQPSSSSLGNEFGGQEDDVLDDEFTSEEEVASTLTRVLGLKVPICPEKVVGRWTLLRSVAAQSQGQLSQNGGENGKKGEKREVTGTLVIGEDEERCREMARLLGFKASRVVNSEEVERMWEREAEANEEKKKRREQEEEVILKKEEPRDQQKEKDLTPKQDHTKGQRQKSTKPTLKLRSRLSCPFDDMKFVEKLCFSPENKIDEESTDDDGSVSEKVELEELDNKEANKSDQIKSPTPPTSSSTPSTPSTPSNPDTVQGQYIPVKHRERTVAYVPVSPTSSTRLGKEFGSPVTLVASIIFFSPPSAKTWDRDVRVVSKLCQPQGEKAPRLYIVQKPGELGHRSPSLASSSPSASANPSPTFSTSPSESSLDTLTSTASTAFSKESSTSTTESAPLKCQFKLTVSRTTLDWIRDVTIHWRASNLNLTEKAELPYYIIDPLTCALQVLEISRQRAESTIWARANLPVHLRQTLRLETLYVVDSGDKPSQLFRNLDKASRNKDKHSASTSLDPDLAFQRYLSLLGVDVIPAKRCKRIWMCNVYEVEKKLEKLGVHGAHMVDNNLEPVNDSQEQIAEEVQDTGAPQHTTQTRQRRTSWLRQLITRGQPRSKGRGVGACGQGQTQRPDTSSSSKNYNKHTHQSNNSTTNLTINSTNVHPTGIPPNVPGIPRSITTPITNTNITPITNTPNYPNPKNTNKTCYTPSATATTVYSPSALNMITRTRTQKARDINAVTAFCHSNNIECGVMYAISHEYWECVDQGFRPVWPIGEPGESWTREGRGGSGYGGRV